MSWGTRRIAGKDYPLGHLDPFEMPVTPQQAGSRTYVVTVAFGAHTFTRDVEATDTPDYLIKDGGETRCFCPIRYGHSLELPRIIRQAANGSAYFGDRHAKFLLVENLPGLNEPYAVMFTADKSKIRGRDATMFIVSAHPRPNLPPIARLPKIRLATLIHLTVGGKPIVRPPKK